MNELQTSQLTLQVYLDIIVKKARVFEEITALVLPEVETINIETEPITVVVNIPNAEGTTDPDQEILERVKADINRCTGVLNVKVSAN